MKKVLTKRSSEYQSFNSVLAFSQCKCSCSCASCQKWFLKNGNKRNSKDVTDLAGKR